MRMIDGGDIDDKIIACHKSPLSSYNNIDHLNSVSPEILEEIKLWFLNYKGENVVKFLNFDTDEKAKDLIKQTSRYFKRFGLKERS